MANENITVKNNTKALYTGAGVLIAVLLITFGLFLYSGSIESDISNKRENISNLQKEISKLKEDKNIMIYELIKANKNNIEKTDKMSDIPNLYSNMVKIGQDFGISFSDFRYASGTIKTKALVKAREGKYPYEIASAFISSFREENNYIFDLETVKALETKSGAEFEITLILK